MDTKKIRESLSDIEDVMYLIDTRHDHPNSEADFNTMYSTLSEALATLKRETGVTTASDAFGEHYAAVRSERLANN
jgi:methylphosphotriester-DNA--protein-cysteine methyltransferase